MDIKEAKDKKVKLRDDLFQLISHFETETGLKVEDVRVEHHIVADIHGEFGSILAKVSIRIEV